MDRELHSRAYLGVAFTPHSISAPCCSTDLMLFREGIKPMWEDESNARGGKLVIRLRKGLASHFWKEIVRVAGDCATLRFQRRF